MESVALHGVSDGPIDIPTLESLWDKVFLGNALAGGLVEALAAVTLEDI